MTDPDLLDPLRYRSGASAEESSGCLDDATLAALAEGAIEAATRSAALSHLASCERCRAIVASVTRALGDPAVARERAALGRRPRRYSIALPIAAAAVLLLAIGVPLWLEEGPIHRAPPGAAQPAPVPLSPIGTVAAATTLRWTSVAEADRYRAIVFAASGRVVYETQLADTVLTLPDSVTLTPGQRYLWKVEARIGPDRWSSSELVQFLVAAEARQ